MRVAIVLSDRSPEVGGGYTYENEVICSLFKLASFSKHKFLIVSDKYFKEENRPALNDKNLNFIKMPKPKRIENFLNTLKLRFPLARILLHRYSSLEKKLRENNIDFVWTIGANQHLLNIPYIANVWDLQHRLQPFFPEVSDKGVWDRRELFYTWYLQRAAIVVVGNETGKKEVEKFYQIPEERIKLLPHMTPSFALNNEQSEANDLYKKYSIKPGYIFYPAQFWPHKNHVNLLFALKSLKDTYGLIIHLVFIGKDHGNLNYIKETISNLNLNEQVSILGFIPQEDLVNLYRNAICLAYVSLFGPENLPPLEAFALGCPVIAMKVSGVEEQLADAALIVEQGSPENISNAIFELVNSNTLRKKLIEKGKERAQEWKSDDFVLNVFKLLDDFEYYRRCWK